MQQGRALVSPRGEDEVSASDSEDWYEQNLRDERNAAAKDRRMSFELTGLDMLRLRPFRRMVREKALRMRQRGTIHPDRPIRTVWAVIRTLAIVYLVFVTSIRVAFKGDIDAFTPWMIVDYTLDLFFLVDIYFHLRKFAFFRGSDPDDYVCKQTDIFKCYLKTKQFKFDVIAALPLDVIALLMYSLISGTTLSNSFAIVYRFRLLKLVKLGTIFSDIGMIRKHSVPNYVVLACTMLSVLHFSACLWQLLQNDRRARLQDDTLQSATNYLPSANAVWGDQVHGYFTALYFVTVTLTCVGFGEIIPLDSLEIGFCILVMVLGFIILTSILALMVHVLKILTHSRSMYDLENNAIFKFMRHYHIPQDIQTRIREYRSQVWARQGALDIPQFLAKLPECMRTEVLVDIVKPAIMKLPHVKLAVSRVKEEEKFEAFTKRTQAATIAKQMKKAGRDFVHPSVFTTNNDKEEGMELMPPSTPSGLRRSFTETSFSLASPKNVKSFVEAVNDANSKQREQLKASRHQKQLQMTVSPMEDQVELLQDVSRDDDGQQADNNNTPSNLQAAGYQKSLRASLQRVIAKAEEKNAQQEQEAKDGAGFVRPPIKMFVHLSDHIRALCSMLRHETYAPGSIIIQHGRFNSKLHLLTQGQVYLFSEHGDLLELRCDPHYFGYKSFMSGAPCELTVVSFELIDVFSLSIDDFQRARNHSPAMEEFVRDYLQRMQVKARQRKPVFQVRSGAGGERGSIASLPSVEGSKFSVPESMRSFGKDGSSVPRDISTWRNSMTQKEYQHVWLPSSRFKSSWNICSLIFMVYYIVVIPFRLVFWRTVETSDLWWLVLDWGVDLFFVIDIYFRLQKFAVVDHSQQHDRLISEPKEIRYWYMHHNKRQFRMDMWSSLPLEAFAVLLGGVLSCRGCDALVWIYVLRLNRLFRMHRMSEYLDVLDVILDTWTHTTLGRFLSARRRLIKLFVLVLIVGHLCGCAWAYVAYWEAEGGIAYTWVVADDLDLFAEEFKSFLRSFYFTMQTMTTIGYGGIVPVTIEEMVFASIYILFATSTYLLLLANLTVITDNASEASHTHALFIQVLRKFMGQPGISATARKRSLLFAHNQWVAQNGVHTSAVLDVVPKHLQRELLSSCFFFILESIPFFNKQLPRNATYISFLLELVDSVKPTCAAPNDVVLHVGQHYREVHMVHTGTVNIVDNETERLLQKVGPGQYFAEEVLLKGVCRSVARYQAETYMLMFVLDYHAFTDAVLRFPSLSKHANIHREHHPINGSTFVARETAEEEEAGGFRSVQDLKRNSSGDHKLRADVPILEEAEDDVSFSRPRGAVRDVLETEVVAMTPTPTGKHAEDARSLATEDGSYEGGMPDGSGIPDITTFRTVPEGKRLPSINQLDAAQAAVGPAAAPPNPPANRNNEDRKENDRLVNHQSSAIDDAMGSFSHEDSSEFSDDVDRADENGDRKSLFANRHKSMMKTLYGRKNLLAYRSAAPDSGKKMSAWQVTKEFLNLGTLVHEGSRFLWDFISLLILSYSAVAIPAQIVFDHPLVNHATTTSAIDISAYWTPLMSVMFVCHLLTDVFFTVDIVLRLNVFSYDSIEEEIRVNASQHALITTHAFVDPQASEAAKKQTRRKHLLNLGGKSALQQRTKGKQLSVVPTEHDQLASSLSSYTHSHKVKPRRPTSRLKKSRSSNISNPEERERDITMDGDEGSSLPRSPRRLSELEGKSVHVHSFQSQKSWRGSLPSGATATTFFNAGIEDLQIDEVKTRLRKRYMHYAIVWDAVALIPFNELFLILLPLLSSSEHTTLLNALSWLRLLRLVRLHRLYHYLAIVENSIETRSTNLNPIVVRIGHQMMTVMVMAHWFACVWLLLLVVEDEHQDWVNTNATGTHVASVSVDSFFYDYLQAMYFIFVTMSTVGYGDIKPVTPLETAFVVVVIAFGCIVYNAVTAELASLAANFDVAEERFETKMESVKRFITKAKLPRQLQKQIMVHYSHLWMTMKGVDDKNVLDTMFWHQASHICSQMYFSHLVSHPLFKGFSKHFVADLCRYVRTEMYNAGTWVKRQGDVADELFILKKGDVELVDDDTRDVLSVLTPANATGFGLDILTVVGTPKRYPVGLRARTPAFLLVVKLREIPHLWELYPKSETMLVRRLFQAANLAEKEAKKEQERQNLPSGGDVFKRTRTSTRQRNAISLVRHMGEKKRRTSHFHTNYTVNKKAMKLFGSNHSGIYAREWVLPNSTFRNIWALVYLFAELVVLITVPIHFGFASMNGSSDSLFWTLLIVGWVMDAVFVSDWWMRVFVFFPLDDKAAEWKNHKFRYYKKNSSKLALLSDFMVLFPSGLLVLLITIDNIDRTGVALARLTLVFLLYRFPQSVKTVDSVVDEYFKQEEVVANNMSSSNSASNKSSSSLSRGFRPHFMTRRIVKLVFVIFLVMHWVSCVWLLFGKEGANSQSWFNRRSFEVQQSEPNMKYLFSVYFAFCTITTTGYGDISPVVAGEMVFCILFILICNFLYGAIIGSVCVYQANDQAPKMEYQRQLQFACKFVSLFGLSSVVEQRLLKFYTTMWTKNKYDAVQGNNLEFPESIRKEVSLFQLNKAVLEVPFFAMLREDRSVLAKLCGEFKSRMAMPSELIVHVGDMSTNLYIVLNGRCVVLLFNPDRTLMKKISLESPVQIGENSFFCNQARSASVKAVTLCDMIELTRESFDKVLSAYPEYAEPISNAYVHHVATTYEDLDARTLNVTTAGATDVGAVALNALKNTPSSKSKTTLRTAMKRLARRSKSVRLSRAQSNSSADEPRTNNKISFPMLLKMLIQNRKDTV